MRVIESADTTSIYLFWSWIVGLSAVVFSVARSRWQRWLFFLYRPLLLTGFSLATLFHVRSYIDAVFDGKPDWAIGLYFEQLYVNPLHLLWGLGLDRFIGFRYWIHAALDVTNYPAAVMATVLWEVMVADLFLGNVIWLIVGSGWLGLVRRREGGKRATRKG